MSNSSLVNDVVWAHPSNYSNSSYRLKITNVTWHHMAGILTAKQCGNIFARAGRNGSAHYGVGSDGRIGLYVDEANVAWHCGNWPNNRASVGIEIANDTIGGDWHVGSYQLELAIKLTADIMQRNGIKKAIAGKTLTWHSMYAATTCPGDYLRSMMEYAATEINKILSGGPAPAPAPAPAPTPTPTPTPSGDGFLPPKGYWASGDNDQRIAQEAAFLRKTFPAYTSAKALGPQYGPNLIKAVREFQRRTGLKSDGMTGPITYAKLQQYGFRYKK